MGHEVKEAIERYHGLLTDETALEAQSSLNKLLRERKLYFGERPLCTVLRPHFCTPAQWDYLQRETSIILGAFATAYQASLKDAGLRTQLSLEPYEESLFSLDHFFQAPWSSSRLDSFYDPENESLRFIEYNAETPAGMTYEDQLAEAFMNLSLFRQFEEYYGVQHLALTGHLLTALLATYREWGGQDQPNIGVVDWGDVPTLNEHELCQAYFETYGFKTILADPRGLEYRHGALYAGDFRIDLIYKRVLVSELIDRMGMDNPIVRAVRDHAVCMSNGFSAKLLAKKSSFALLGDERNEYLFRPGERAAIEAHIPWTRRVEERKTYFHGQAIDLLPFILDHRESLVLKPNDEYGGRGVIIGWQTPPDEWQAALRGALNTPFVVQERVHIASEDYPSIVAGKLDISSRLIDADPYIFQGKLVGGSLTRLSSVALLNVTAGGGSAVPTFIVRRAE
ncbi:MAG TPA: hypothetical protein VMT34_03690 [Aggregatilineales bacterium]|nr:hypothetical protein [Aggregatilineales bacterium]